MQLGCSRAPSFCPAARCRDHLLFLLTLLNALFYVHVYLARVAAQEVPEAVDVEERDELEKKLHDGDGEAELVQMYDAPY